MPNRGLDRRTPRALLALLGAIGLTLAFASALGAQTGIQPTAEDQILLVSDAQEFENFGTSVAIDDETLVIGSRFADATPDGGEGATYVFTRTGNTWTETQKLTASDGQQSDFFGERLAIDGDTIVIGAPSRADNRAGAAYVFTRTGNTWTETQKLTASDGQPGDLWGQMPVIDGDTIVIGGHIFTRTGNTWIETQILSVGGESAIDGDTIVIGRTRTDDGVGAAYVFTRTGNTWTETTKLTASDGDTGGSFGEALAIDGDTIVIGARFAGVGSNPIAGAAYVFNRTGNTWTETQRLTSPDHDVFPFFGADVAIDGNTIVVEDSNPQAAYVFGNSGDTWTPRQALAPSVGSISGPVALAGDTIVLAAPDLLGGDGSFTPSVSVFGVDLEQPLVLVCEGAVVTVDLAAGERPTSGNDVILGTAGPDVINAGDGADIICALGGDDIINAGNGADTVFAGFGDDTIQAGQGRDAVFGGAGDDFISGGKGKDVLNGGFGRDDLRGNEGTDTLVGGPDDDELRGGQKADIIFGDDGNDTLICLLYTSPSPRDRG